MLSSSTHITKKLLSEARGESKQQTSLGPYEKKPIPLQQLRLIIQDVVFFIKHNPALIKTCLLMFLPYLVKASRIASWTSPFGQDWVLEEITNASEYTDCGDYTIGPPEQSCDLYVLEGAGMISIDMMIAAIGVNSTGGLQYPIAKSRAAWDSVPPIFDFLYQFTNAHAVKQGSMNCLNTSDISFHAKFLYQFSYMFLDVADTAICDAFDAYMKTIILPAITHFLEAESNNDFMSSSSAGGYTDSSSVSSWVIVGVCIAILAVLLGTGFGCRYALKQRQQAQLPEEDKHIPDHRQEEKKVPDVAMDIIDFKGGPNRVALQKITEQIMSDIGLVDEDSFFYDSELKKIQKEFAETLVKFSNAFGLTFKPNSNAIEEIFPLDNPVRIVLEDESLSAQVYDGYLLDEYSAKQQQLDPAILFIDSQTKKAWKLIQDYPKESIIDTRCAEISNPVTLCVQGDGEVEVVDGIFDGNRVGNKDPYRHIPIVEKRKKELAPDEKGEEQCFLLKHQVQIIFDAHLKKLVALYDSIQNAIPAEGLQIEGPRKKRETAPLSLCYKSSFMAEKAALTIPLLKEKAEELVVSHKPVFSCP